MSTAICYSGEARTFAKCLPNHQHMLLRHFPDAHVFVSVADDDDAGFMELLRGIVPGDRLVIEREEQPDIEEPENLERLLAATAHKIAAHSTVQGVLRQFWQMGRVGRMLKVKPFTTVIRVRPDLLFHSVPDHWPQPGSLECFTPWWARAGGVNDRFAIMGGTAARHYFGTLEWAQDEGWRQGCPVHPESMLAESLRVRRVQVSATLRTTFSFLRKDGSLILPDPSMEDIADLVLATKGSF